MPNGQSVRSAVSARNVAAVAVAQTAVQSVAQNVVLSDQTIQAKTRCRAMAALMQIRVKRVLKVGKMAGKVAVKAVAMKAEMKAEMSAARIVRLATAKTRGTLRELPLLKA
jgi:hypothetical protein